VPDTFTLAGDREDRPLTSASSTLPGAARPVTRDGGEQAVHLIGVEVAEQSLVGTITAGTVGWEPAVSSASGHEPVRSVATATRSERRSVCAAVSRACFSSINPERSTSNTLGKSSR